MNIEIDDTVKTSCLSMIIENCIIMPDVSWIAFYGRNRCANFEIHFSNIYERDVFIVTPKLIDMSSDVITSGLIDGSVDIRNLSEFNVSFFKGIYGLKLRGVDDPGYDSLPFRIFIFRRLSIDDIINSSDCFRMSDKIFRNCNVEYRKIIKE